MKSVIIIDERMNMSGLQTVDSDSEGTDSN